MPAAATPFAILRNAESFVEVCGDPNWFREHYTLQREILSVADSVEAALRSQGLWNAFCKLHYPHKLA